MKKYVALLMIVAIISGSFLLFPAHIDHSSPLVVQENGNSASSTSEDLQPIDGYGKHKITMQGFEMFVFVGFYFIFSFRFVIQLVRRLIVLTPIFYQSNYVVSPLLKTN